MSNEQAIVHRGEEYGQARKLEPSEVLAFMLVSGAKAGAVSIAAGAVVVGGRLVIGENVSVASIALTTVGVGAVSFAVNVLGDLDSLVDGLRSFRLVETFAPPQSGPATVTTPSSPIVVKPYGGEPYILGAGDDMPMLPDGRQAALGLNPPTLAAVLQEVIQQHGGQWSRRRLTSIRIDGQRITRALYEELTSKLANAGFLQAQPQGGFSLPPDVQTFEDAHRYLPGLPTGQAGGQAGGRAGPPGNDDSPAGRVGGALTLAEKRRQRWLECDCDAKLYLQGRQDHV